MINVVLCIVFLYFKCFYPAYIQTIYSISIYRFIIHLPLFSTFINHICHSKSVISCCRCLIRPIIFRQPRCAVLNTTSFIPLTIMYRLVCLNFPPHIVQQPSSPVSIIRMFSLFRRKHIYPKLYIIARY